MLWTPLHQAAKNGHDETVKALAACGADVNARDNWLLTPLHHAVDEGRTETVKALAACGADVNARGC